MSQERLDQAPIIVSGVVASVIESQSQDANFPDCMIRHVVTIAIEGKNEKNATVVRGYYSDWKCYKDKNGHVMQQPVGHFATWGIRSIRVGDIVKIFSGTDGNIFEPNGLELIKPIDNRKY